MGASPREFIPTHHSTMYGLDQMVMTDVVLRMSTTKFWTDSFLAPRVVELTSELPNYSTVLSLGNRFSEVQ